MVTVIKKKYKKTVKDFLWDRYHLVFEHLGFENNESIDEICKTVLEFCERKNIIGRTAKINPLFRDKFLQEVSQIICYWLRTKYHKQETEDGETIVRENKYFLRGFECEIVGGKGHYYYPKNPDEQNRISISDKSRLDSKIKGFEIREIERVDYQKLLPSMNVPELPKHLDEKNKDVA